MNFEQVLKLPTTREEFIVDTFTNKKLVYAEGLGLLGYEQRKEKNVPPRPGTNESITTAPFAAVMFIYAPTEEYFKKKVVVDPSLDIVRFNLYEAIKLYKPNTGLTLAKDKNGLVLFLLNYRKELDGSEKITLIGMNEKFLEKSIRMLPAYCSVGVNESTGLVTVTSI